MQCKIDPGQKKTSIGQTCRHRRVNDTNDAGAGNETGRQSGVTPDCLCPDQAEVGLCRPHPCADNYGGTYRSGTG